VTKAVQGRVIAGEPSDSGFGVWTRGKSWIVLEVLLDEPAEAFLVFFFHVDEFDAAAVGADVADDGGKASLVCDLKVLAPGDVVGNQDVNTIETSREIGKRKSPSAFCGLAATDV
jgi:hypothetical protein